MANKQINKTEQPLSPLAIVDKWLDGIVLEILASSVLLPVSEADKAWNAANKRAASIVLQYKTGDGLFQQGD